MGVKRLFNDDWHFMKTGLEADLDDVRKQADGFRAVDIPHDWLIYDAGNLYETGCGWYRKRFLNKVDTGGGKHVLLRFDGVYMDCEVFLNGEKVKEWKYGYSTFDVDLSPVLVAGENEIFVRVRHQAPNSRWYSGAGIYRNVWIKECEELFLTPDGSYVVSRPCKEGFLLEVDTEVSGSKKHSAEVGYSLWYGGEPVLDMGRHKVDVYRNSDAGDTVEAGAVSMSGMEERHSMGEIEVAGRAAARQIVVNPRIWDTRDPACYELRVALYDGSHKEATEEIHSVEEESITVGFRTMEFDSGLGFLLNGRRVKVHGVCEHHDFGCLGAVFSVEAMRRKFCKLREMGVNGIRTSHNMPAPELMELADEMGFLVVSEAFDMWELSKTEFDYARFFKEWADRDVASWVRRDRNHPSLMLWSIGNEIYDTHISEHGQEITHRLMELVKPHDPKENGRVTIGSNFMPWENAQKCADLVKIAGYNYGERYYDLHHEKYPDWVIYGSETASVVQSRGVYHFPLAQPLLADEDEQCSALGNSTTSWGAKSVEKCITVDRDADYNFGQFLWTGFDYIGEPTPYHTKNSYFGHLDTAGFPKDSYYIFQAEWTDVKKRPMVHLFPYWDFNEGQLIDLRACTNGAAVELFVNGESQGKQEIDHKRGEKLLGEWKVPYKKGSVKAVAYDEEGKVIAQETRSSFGDAVGITLRAEKEVLRADGEDLCFLTIGAEDAAGNPVENAMNYVTVKVDGPGRLLGLDNGDSTDYDNYKGDCRKLFNGKLLAVIGTVPGPGEIMVTVSGEGLTGGCLTLNSVNAPVRSGISVMENWSGSGRNSENSRLVPVRKMELRAAEGQILTIERPQVMVEARIYPENATDRSLIWRAVNDAGIEIPFVSIEEVKMEERHSREGGHSTEGHIHTVRVTAHGDGEFRIRCMSRNGSQKVKLISGLEFSARGLGYMYISPYDFIAAGLFAESIGELGNGNEKGIATARDGVSGAVYSNIDFGDYGSDEITIPVFALSDEEYPIEIWLGKPGEDGRKAFQGSELLFTGIYQKPSIWNVYQEVTWKLPRRIKGVVSIAFLLRNKVHIKGFWFRKYDKAFSRLYAAECSRIYGDSFTVDQEAVTEIGNNVTLQFENMDFGQEGAGQITICGKTDLPVNTIHILFTTEDMEEKHSRETVRQIVEFAGGGHEGDYQEQQFVLERLQGRGKVEFMFLPGSSFDFREFWFE